MSDILYDQIPSLDLADFTGGDPVKKKKFVADLGAAYNNIGFVAIRNHYLPDDLSERLYTVIKKFFSLPDAVKQKYEIPGLAGQRGYVGKGKEHAKGRNTGDLKEFYHIGQEVEDARAVVVPADDQLAARLAGRLAALTGAPRPPSGRGAAAPASRGHGPKAARRRPGRPSPGPRRTARG